MFLFERSYKPTAVTPVRGSMYIERRERYTSKFTCKYYIDLFFFKQNKDFKLRGFTFGKYSTN